MSPPAPLDLVDQRRGRGGLGMYTSYEWTSRDVSDLSSSHAPPPSKGDSPSTRKDDRNV